MNKIEDLRTIAESIGLTNIVKELTLIELRSKQENANIILPLVGEFSSGKTTLINALTDSKGLESATKPTTATIYEVHFGSESCHAEVIDADGNCLKVENINNLKNEELADAKVVTAFDTSTRIPASTIIVDTPGLSSSDPQHKQTLVDFLPKADGILLVTDINQQITRSLADFIEMIKLSQRPIYLLLTKSDTKSKEDIESAKEYICNNCKIPLKQVAVVSATKDSLEELYTLLDSIQKEKKDLLKRVDEQRLKNISKMMLKQIEELMSASSSDEDTDEAIRKCQKELDRIKRQIERLVDSVADDINGIQAAICEKARNQSDSENEDGISLESLKSMNLPNIQMTGLTYNMDLNGMGHEYDQWIKVGVIAAAAVGTVAAVAATAGGAAAAGGALASGKAIDAIDTVSDVGSIIFNQEAVSRIEKTVTLATKVTQQYETIENGAQALSGKVGSDKGLIDSMVGFVTDKLLSKPQRVRAVHNYIDSSLSPDFKNRLKEISQELVNIVRVSLNEEATEIINLKTSSLNQLKAERKEQKEQFEQRISQLREYKTLLLTL